MAGKKIEVKEENRFQEELRKTRPTGIIEVRTSSGMILFEGELTADEISKLNHDYLSGVTNKLTITIDGQQND